MKQNTKNIVESQLRKIIRRELQESPIRIHYGSPYYSEPNKDAVKRNVDQLFAIAKEWINNWYEDNGYDYNPLDNIDVLMSDLQKNPRWNVAVSHYGSEEKLRKAIIDFVKKIIKR